LFVTLEYILVNYSLKFKHLISCIRRRSTICTVENCSAKLHNT